MIKLSTLSVVCGFALMVAAAPPVSASNLAPEVETRAAPHQELMLFLMRGPGDPTLFEGKRVAVVIENGADAVTLLLARDYFLEQGATVEVLTPRGKDEPRLDPARRSASSVTARDYAGNERRITVDAFLDETEPGRYEAIYLPGNHPDTQTAESNPQIAGYAARATSAGKPVFAVGDSSLWLARANLLRGRHATGSRALQPFLVWSGVEVQDEPVVRDDLIYTSRDAFDLPKLMAVMTQLLTIQ